MLTPNQIRNQVDQLIRYLVKIGLTDDENCTFIRSKGSSVEVTFDGAEHILIAFKRGFSYDQIYEKFVQECAYNVKMLDGALIQIMYKFANRTLQCHRLAFFPAPHFDEFQNDSYIYQDDQVYADVIARNIVPFPVRFDYNIQDNRHQKLIHPKSHLSLGQYKNCRIPVTAPMTPFWFIDFILRNFYNTNKKQYTNQLPIQNGSFDESIDSTERGIIHIVVPILSG